MLLHAHVRLGKSQLACMVAELVIALTGTSMTLICR